MKVYLLLASLFSTWYPVIGLPPSSSGTSQLRSADSAVILLTARFLGGVGLSKKIR